MAEEESAERMHKEKDSAEIMHGKSVTVATAAAVLEGGKKSEATPRSAKAARSESQRETKYAGRQLVSGKMLSTFCRLSVAAVGV